MAGRVPPALAAALLAIATVAVAQDQPPATDSGQALVAREQGLRDQFRELERTFLRLADLLAASDPRRAALLRSAFEQSRDGEVTERLDSIVAMLEKGQLLKAGTSQAGAIDKLRELLVLLEAGDTDRRLANTKEEVRQFLARLGKVIARQRDVEGSTEAGGDADKLSERQDALARDTESLARDIGSFAKRLAPPAPGADAAGADGKKPGDTPAGKPATGDEKGRDGATPEKPDGEGDAAENADMPKADDQPPEGEGAGPADGKGGTPRPGKGKPDAKGKPQPGGQPSDGEGEPQDGAAEGDEPAPEGDDEASRAERTKQRLGAAGKRMQQARERLDDANRRGAREDQEKAVEELESARAELEEILRQLREEEVERVLVQLGARLRSMLRVEKGVLSGAEKLAAGDGGAASDRERQVEATRLSRDQGQVATEATRALALVRDDGSAVAIPEALVQLHEDAVQAAGRLGRGDTGTATRGIIQDIVANLEEMIAALEKAQREQQAKAKGESGGRPAQPGEQPLVDKLAELKMIRSLQMRVNTRTGRFSQLLGDGTEQAEEPELFDAVRRLAERQRTIERAAHDIVSGRTE